MIKTGCESLKAQGDIFSTASHGLGHAVFDVFEGFFTACADAQIAALTGKG